MRPAEAAGLFLRIAGLEARKLMSYRVDFWLNSVAAFLAQLAVAYFLWLAVFETTGKPEIGGFTLAGMVTYYVLAILLGKMIRGQERQAGLARDIYDGTLTRYLVFPLAYFRFKYAEHVGALLPALVQLAVFGSVAFLLFELPPEIRITAGSLARAAVAVAMGNLLHFLIVYPVEGVAFWADNVWSLNVMARFTGELLGGLLLPLTLFPGWARQTLELLPFQYLFYFPVMTLLGRVSPGEWLRGMAVALVWCGLIALAGRAVWRRGYRVYSGVGI
ncbi:MAG: ABC-2 family transporter protein [Thermoanaerobaculia bacterium]|nr:ABC-2 family transporter protein [Thermoanaerobaculia bacterium]